MGCDGFATSDDGDRRPIKAADIKMFRKGSYLIGFAGSIRTGQIIQRGDFKAPKQIWGWPDLIREQITEKGALITTDEQVQMQSSNFIFAHQGRLYEMLADFQMNEIDETGYTAIGAGSTIAMGSLYTSQGLDMDVEQRIRLALKAACEFAVTCGPPFRIEML